MKTNELQPDPEQPAVPTSRRARLQALLFQGAALGAAILMAAGSGGGEHKWPLSAGE